MSTLESSNGASPPSPLRHCITVPPDRQVLTRQRLPYFVGISGSTAGTNGPPDLPHQAFNLSDSEPARAIVLDRRRVGPRPRRNNQITFQFRVRPLPWENARF